ncbi:hypothetical protein RHGRI_022842 [Rhododendron griersonianum]|uniref:F-box/LRR-repeat protein n=1 Tax=Rhododendron griersonianum TaxID=479676 RepID=A0AAV6J1I9_9ERIC|nr:hypothetical protein RHGRI_022842 [Rhododendron griersonianum]
MDRILCDELLEEVLGRLPPRSTFSPSTADDVSLVSKRWLRLYRSSKSTLLLHLFPYHCTPTSLSSFLSHFPHLSALVIAIVPDSSDLRDQLLLSVASSCPKLTVLNVRSDPVSLFPLLSLSTSCPHLTCLVVSLPRPHSFHWLLSFHSLKTLSVVFASASAPTEFQLFDAASKGNYLVDAELKLETLYLSGIQQGDYGFDWLWRSCKNLKKLLLQCCKGIGDDTSVSSLVNCFKGLQEMELRWCRPIVTDILMRLAENCTSLNSLLIYNRGSKEGLLQFITHSRCNLQKLHLQTPFDLENNHLLAVADKFRGLLSLELRNCMGVTGEGLKSMALAMSNKLEELALIQCRVEPGLLPTLGQKFRNLSKLDLSYNRKLVDKEFISMLVLFNCLREVRVRGCKGLTNASVISMFKSCKQLEIVDIIDCPGIESESVELFILNCLRLRQIHVEESKLSNVSRSWASKKLVKVVV